MGSKPKPEEFEDVVEYEGGKPVTRKWKRRCLAGYDHYGFCQLGNRYRMSPARTEAMEKVVEHDAALRSFVAATQDHLTRQWRLVASEKAAAWRSIYSDLGLSPKTHSLAWVDGEIVATELPMEDQIKTEPGS